MSRLSRGQDALVARQRAGGAMPEGTITYTRGAESADLTGSAWVGRTVYQRTPQETDGAAIVFGDRDYLVVAAALVIGGLRVEPAEGDRITHAAGGVTLEFSVRGRAGEPAWRYSDPGRSVLRVHVKQKQK